MQVAQRGVSATGITVAGYFTADRWNLAFGTLGTWTNTIENDAPAGSGLRQSFKVLASTADAAPAAADYAVCKQLIEGRDCLQIKKGSSSAESLTLSFWVKSNVTGAFIAEIEDVTNTRTVSASYTISAAGTWERKTITFPADTTGVPANDNSGALAVAFYLAMGSNYTSGTLQTAWGATTAANRAVGQTNLAATVNNYWQMTGAQLEVGSTATPYEFKSYADDLRQCQRYCVSWQGIAGGPHCFAAYAPGLYADANQLGMLSTKPFGDMRTQTVSLTMVGTQGTDWAVYSSSGVAQTGFTVAAFPHGVFTASKTAHGLSAAFLATITANAKVIISADL